MTILDRICFRLSCAARQPGSCTGRGGGARSGGGRRQGHSTTQHSPAWHMIKHCKHLQQWKNAARKQGLQCKCEMRLHEYMQAAVVCLTYRPVKDLATHMSSQQQAGTCCVWHIHSTAASQCLECLVQVAGSKQPTPTNANSRCWHSMATGAGPVCRGGGG